MVPDFRPDILGDAGQERRGPHADGVDDGEGIDEVAVGVVERAGPFVLVHGDDGWLLGSDEPADAGGGDHLGVGAVADDLVNGPFIGRRAPVMHLLRGVGEGDAKGFGATGVLLDEADALFR